MIRTLLVSIVAVAAVLAALPAQATAFSCAYSNPASATEFSTVIFEGVAQPGPSRDGHLLSPARFEVTRYLKGSGAPAREVTTSRPGPEEPSDGGGVSARAGETWTIYGRVGEGGVIQAGYCDPSERGPASRPKPRPEGLEPGRSIAGAALGIGFESALQLLGPRHRGMESSLRRGWWEWLYASLRVSVVFNQEGRVRRLSTSSERDQTAENIGVGSSGRRLRLKFPGVECRAVSRITRSCVLAGGGGRTTEFLVRDKLIYKITVALPAPAAR